MCGNNGLFQGSVLHNGFSISTSTSTSTWNHFPINSIGSALGTFLTKHFFVDTHTDTASFISLTRDKAVCTQKAREDIHQLSNDDWHDDGVVTVNQLLALSTQTFVRNELAGFLQVTKNLSLQSHQYLNILGEYMNKSIESQLESIL